MFNDGDIIENRFRILCQIGRGTQGIIYKAVDIKTKQVYAIKLYRFIDALLKQDLKQIEDEAILLQQLNHPNIVHCYQILKYPTEYLIIFEYIDGCSLQDFITQQFPNKQNLESLIDFKQLYEQIKIYQDHNDIRYQYHSIIRQLLKDKVKQQPIDEQILAPGFNLNKTQKVDLQIAFELVKEQQELKVEKGTNSLFLNKVPNYTQPEKRVTYRDTIEYLFSQLLEVLVLLQEKGVMHRDLKPDNIMITKSVQLKLIDFGFSKKAVESSTLCGTPGFLAPEISTVKASERNYNHKVDIWSAGCLFYQMLFGYNPFLVNRYIMFEAIQATKGLYLPTDIFGENYADQKYIDMIERAFIVNPNQRPNAKQLQKLFFASSSEVLTKVELKSELIHTVKIFLTGDYGTGKSTLLKKFATSALQQQMQKVSRNVVVNNKRVQLDFYDTLGTEQRNCSLIPSLTRDTNLCFLVCKLQDESSYDSLGSWKHFVENQSSRCEFISLGVDFGGEKVVHGDLIEINEGTDLEAILMNGVKKCMDQQYFNIDEVKVPVQKQGKQGCC
ncbi:Kinase [Hexamita inflata]|uniref:Kinase n=1 Tax=Hexamita inflata TaxID=28002 RepID=A0AA86Q1J6_9EUKA|nr:Kinase [Hexamita inflata]CAI9944960.1 Kinase [Hexamita inflata]